MLFFKPTENFFNAHNLRIARIHRKAKRYKFCAEIEKRQEASKKRVM